jgi:hypothetical protein
MHHFLNRKCLFFLILFSFRCYFLFSQTVQSNGFKRTHTLIRSGEWIMDKDFYLLTALDKFKEARLSLESDHDLSKFLVSQRQLIDSRAKDSSLTNDAIISGLIYSSADTSFLLQTLATDFG